MSIPVASFASALVLSLSAAALASSHREAPFVTELPKVDATDFYLFTSYEPGREDFVTLIANYLPLQDAYGGPNYFTLDPEARYEIHVDNDGDALADVTFTFEFATEFRALALDVGPQGDTRSVSIPLAQQGVVTEREDPDLNVVERYSVTVRRDGKKDKPLKDATSGATTFVKPFDNVGNKTIPDYAAYAAQHRYDVELPGGAIGRMFVGQRKDPFVVNLGEVFDLVNVANPIGAPNAELDSLADKNVTTIALEIPKSFLLDSQGTVIGAWTTASLPRNRTLKNQPDVAQPANEKGGFVQVSRLGNPLVNEVVIGIDAKDLFNASRPDQDAKRFADYVTHPTFPELLEILFAGAGVQAPNLFPRQDLVDVFLLGVEGLNRIAIDAVPGEMMRLDTATPALAAASQNTFGVLGGDLAGYPNGRRPGDDVVDITLRAAMGALLDVALAPSGALPFTDGAAISAAMFDSTFPYLVTPLPGSPQN